jgi:hypothetical protein
MMIHAAWKRARGIEDERQLRRDVNECSEQRGQEAKRCETNAGTVDDESPGKVLHDDSTAAPGDLQRAANYALPARQNVS